MNLRDDFPPRPEVVLDYELAIVMAPLDLDKYAEIAKQCKYLPENDLKVSTASCYVGIPQCQRASGSITAVSQ